MFVLFKNQLEIVVQVLYLVPHVDFKTHLFFVTMATLLMTCGRYDLNNVARNLATNQ